MKNFLSTSNIPIQSVREKVQKLPRDGKIRSVLRVIKKGGQIIVSGERFVRKYSKYRWYRKNKPCTVVVLGMHRSGTSCITRIINLCGARVGGDLLGAKESNKKGHWEHLYGQAINRELLLHSGGSWKNPPSEIEDNPILRIEIRSFISDLHNGCKPVVWKDPRTCLTYPIWKPFLLNPVPVVVFRNPMSVAKSLNKRSNIPVEKGIYLWKVYNKKIITMDEKRNSYYINFDAGREHIEKSVKSISLNSPLQFKKSSLDFYEPSLRRSDSSVDVKNRDVKEIYNELIERSKT